MTAQKDTWATVIGHTATSPRERPKVDWKSGRRSRRQAARRDGSRSIEEVPRWPTWSQPGTPAYAAGGDRRAHGLLRAAGRALAEHRPQALQDPPGFDHLGRRDGGPRWSPCTSGPRSSGIAFTSARPIPFITVLFGCTAEPVPRALLPRAELRVTRQLWSAFTTSCGFARSPAACTSASSACRS